MNLILRQPLWNVHHSDSRKLGSHSATSIPILDIHELAAGKLTALMSRGQARDLFDCSNLFKMEDLENSKIRLGFVLYGAMNRKDWRTIDIEDIGFDPGDLNSQLIPTLDTQVADAVGTPREYGNSLVEDCKRGMESLLPFSDNEQEFLDLILDQGMIDGGLLTPDPDLQKRITVHPSLNWKAINIKKHRGL
ncbi:MAG: nucleotidyl transferase AbiEii/AbiGii toxin family protein [Candidatus Marinimicrobia bacterium]|nr:nucleotidyl transferase AbiEii/AbiGii toxin family protein [Candidatus Neomarinimicrobiota bacterium]